MAEITAAKVKELRDITQAGFMDCKRAVEGSDGDMEQAITRLRERGQAAASKRAGREAREGLIGSYVHTGGRIGVLIEVNSESDFVARNEQFQKLVRDLAIQVAGLNPRYIDVEDIPGEVVEAKRAELAEDARTRDDVEANLNRWTKEVALLEQPFRDTNMTVRDLITNRSEEHTSELQSH